MKTTETSPTTAIVNAIICGKFTGALSGFQSVVFRDLKYAGFDARTAHKIAMDYGSQLGNAMRNDENIRTSVGKANKNGIAKMSGAFHDKLIMHNSMAIYRVVQTVADLASKEKLLAGYEIDMNNLAERLLQYVGECKIWADAQVWE